MLLPEELCGCCWRKTAAACVWVLAVSCCSWRVSNTSLSLLPVESWCGCVLGTCTYRGSSWPWLDWQRVMSKNQLF